MGTDGGNFGVSAKKTAFPNLKKRPFFGVTFSRNFFRAQILCPLFAHFFQGFFGRLGKNVKNRVFGQKKWANGQKFLKSGQASKPLFMRVCGFSAHFPTFYSNYYKEKSKILYRIKNKSGFLARAKFLRKFREEK